MIHPFSYRNPRLATSLPVQFTTGAAVLFGSMQDISEQGMSVDFAEPVVKGTTGRVRFCAGSIEVNLQAEVTHSTAFSAGLVFTFSSEQEVAYFRAIVQSLRGHGPSVQR